MRRLARYALNALTVLSLLLCVATVVLWVRSYWVVDSFQHHRPDAVRLCWRTVSVSQQLGRVRFELDRTTMETPGGFAMIVHDRTPTSPPGFSWSSRPVYPGEERFGDRDGSGLFATETARWTKPHVMQFRPVRLDHGDLYGEREAVVVAHVLIASLLSFVPLLWLFRYWRANRFGGGPGLCRRCGYDLRATPDCCPECGAVPADLRA